MERWEKPAGTRWRPRSALEGRGGQDKDLPFSPWGEHAVETEALQLRVSPRMQLNGRGQVHGLDGVVAAPWGWRAPRVPSGSVRPTARIFLGARHGTLSGGSGFCMQLLGFAAHAELGCAHPRALSRGTAEGSSAPPRPLTPALVSSEVTLVTSVVYLFILEV